MKCIFSMMLITFIYQSQADEILDNDIFAIENKVIAFESENQLSEYIKNNMTSTYRYFERLSSISQKKVFQEYQTRADKNITQIVLDVYRKSPRR